MKTKNYSHNKYDICIIGGCGHVGAPLAILFASKGFKVVGYDINQEQVAQMNSGKMWFIEPGCPELLKKALKKKNIHFSTNPLVIKFSKFLIVCIGTPVDEHGNPKFSVIDKLIQLLKKHIYSREQIIIIRSTVYPGTTEYIQRKLEKKVRIAFCPERIAEGFALKECQSLPQIVASPNKKTLGIASKLFSRINKNVYKMDNFKEAEFVKIITNSFRYINFAIPNQFFMIAQRDNLNFNNIYKAASYKYPRMQGFVNKGFVGGTCLYKDTMQLNTFHNNYFTLGQAAVSVNEGLPNFVVEILMERYGSLEDKTIGILGMTYKADIDDIRESLSFKLKKLLSFRSKKVKWHDPYLKNDKNCKPFREVISCDIVILATPHSYYKKRINQLKKIKKFYNATYWQI